MTNATTPPLPGYKFAPICLAALLLLLANVLVHQKRVMEGIGFLQDRAYVDICVARSLLHHDGYGIAHDQLVPMTADVPWRYAIAAGSWLFVSYKVAPVILSVLFSAWALLVTVRLVRRLQPSLGVVLFGGLLLIVSPAFVVDTLSGTSQALATLLVVLATALHIRGLEPERKPLPFMSAFLLGIAACVRLEFIVLWLVFCIHAVLMSFFNYRQKSGFTYALIKGLSGLVLIAICLAPMIGWNVRVIGVPWPRIAGAPLTLDALGDGSAGARISDAIHAALTPAYAEVFHAPLLAPAWGTALFGIGLIALAVAMVRRRETRAFAVLPLVFLVAPVLIACLQPLLGSGGTAVVARALAPLAVVVMAFGLHALAALPVYALARGGITSTLAQRAVFIIPAAIFLSLAASRCRATVREDLAARERVEAARGKVSQVIRTGVLKTGVVATDEPGWLTYACKLPVIDLTGELSPLVLTQLDASGQVDVEGLAGFLAKAQPVAMFLWTDRFEELPKRTPCEQPFPEAFQKDRPRPAIYRFSWNAAP